MVNIRKFLQGIGLIPVTSSTIDTKGELEVLDASGKLNYFNGTSASPVVTEAHSATLTNKTIDADSNTITNIENADIKSAAAIDASKLADGSVSNTEFQYINSVTSNVQDQLDSKQSNSLTSAHIFVGNGSNVAADVAVSGDLTLTNTGDFQIATDVIVNADINASAAIARTKIANGTADHVVINNGSGTLSSEAQLAVSRGGTGVSSLTSNGVVIGNGTSGVTVTAEGATGTVLRGSTGNDPSFGAVVLTTDVTGVLPSANVGLGRTINAQTGTSYTFVLSDGSAAGANTLVTASNASAQTYTVPPNSSVAFPVGTQIDILQLGAGKVTLAQGSGVTINSKGSNKAIGAQYVGVTLIKTATDTWSLLGDLIA